MTPKENIIEALQSSNEANLSVVLRRVALIDTKACFPDIEYIQHVPYERSIAALRNRFVPAWMGIIAVSKRADGRYSILDGATRWQVCIDKGIEKIPAEIYEGLTLKEEAEIYITKCQNTQRSPIDWYKAYVTAEHPTYLAVKRILDKQGLQASSIRTVRGTTPGIPMIYCVKCLMGFAEKRGVDLLDKTLGFLISIWGRDPQALTDRFIPAMGRILEQAEGRFAPGQFIGRLSSVDPRKLLLEANQLRAGHTPPPLVFVALALKMVEYYNKGRTDEKKITLV